jgi:hypothetical protein
MLPAGLDLKGSSSLALHTTQIESTDFIYIFPQNHEMIVCTYSWLLQEIMELTKRVLTA